MTPGARTRMTVVEVMVVEVMGVEVMTTGQAPAGCA
jgi:hypothetical protein